MQGRRAPIAAPGSWAGLLLLAAWTAGTQGSAVGHWPAAGPREQWRYIRIPMPSCHFLGDKAVGVHLSWAVFSLGFSWTLSGRGPRAATAGSVERALGKPEGVLLLQPSGPGWVDEVELAFLELSRRFSCCVSLLTLSQTHRTAPARPATHRLVSVVCLSSRGSPSSLPTAMFLQKELGCCPLVGMQGGLFVRIWRDAERTIKDKCAASCF